MKQTNCVEFYSRYYIKLHQLHKFHNLYLHNEETIQKINQ